MNAEFVTTQLYHEIVLQHHAKQDFIVKRFHPPKVNFGEKSTCFEDVLMKMLAQIGRGLVFYADLCYNKGRSFAHVKHERREPTETRIALGAVFLRTK